jgi:hypothetical protein
MQLGTTKEQSMSDPMKQAWNDVAETFTSLGRAMKDHYERFEHDEAPDEADRPDVGGVRAALDRVVDAGRDVGERIVGTVADEDVKAQARQALHALNEALSATVEIVGEQLSSVVKRSSTRSRESAPSDSQDEDAETILDATESVGSSPGDSPADSATKDADAAQAGSPPDRDGLGSGALGEQLP